MENRKNIVQYRERLDKTLSSFDLTNDQKLKSLVESQFCRSSQSERELEGYEEKLEIKTAELSNCLDMMRTVSAGENGESSTSHADWKLTQDNEDFRVMYREGPEGTPYHTLMVEGYVDAPVDVSLCLTWESPLYKKWWPQFTVPTFKVTASDCLQKVQNGEQIVLVRMKPPWPLSTREAIVHFYLFEYFQDDLIVILLKSVTESEKTNETIDGSKNDVIPEAKGAVRIDVLGGIVLQKVTSERSYVRAIANLDIKIDFMPPSLINFISRQIIGSGFRLFQKAVASKMNGDKEFSKALTDLLFVRIREALYSTDESNAMDEEELKQVASIFPAEELSQSNHDRANDMSRKDRSNQNANNDASSEEIAQSKENVTKVHDIPIEEGDTSIVLKGNRNCEIVDADNEEIVEGNIGEIVQIEKDANKIHGIPSDEDDACVVLNRKSNCEIIDADSKEIVEENIEEMVQIEKDVKKVNDISNDEGDTSIVLKGCEIVDANSEEIVEAKIEYDDTKGVLKRKSNVNISSNVRQALETLERAISSVRKYGFHSRRFSFSFANEATICKEKGGEFDPHSAKLFQPSVKNDVNVEEPSNNIQHESSDDLYEIQNFRHTETNPNTKEVNFKKVVPAFPNENLIETRQVDSYTGQDLSSGEPIKSNRQKNINNLVTQGISSDVPKQLSKKKNYRYCCFMH
ncbi:hypothetical protein QL285_040754 [Trifolium repens]|nr:hypothetical protein QL285_040754 [Trifolium repens]